MVRVKTSNYILLIASSLFILDLITKILVRMRMTVGNSVPVIDNILYFTHLQNTGAGFSLFTGYNNLLIIIYLAALVIIFYSWKQMPKEKWPMFFMGIILGGIVGNLVDRVFFGYVTDFIDFRVWPVFNVADSGVSVGIFGLILYEIMKNKQKILRKNA